MLHGAAPDDPQPCVTTYVVSAVPALPQSMWIGHVPAGTLVVTVHVQLIPPSGFEGLEFSPAAVDFPVE